jgi:GT2 family glycosyltransferase
MTNPFVSIVIPMFNHMEISKAMLESLLFSLPINLKFEIIIVDDYSTDDTSFWLSLNKHSNIIVHTNATNLGYAKSNNLGAKLSIGKYLLFLNNDLLFEEGWFEPLINIIENNILNAGIVGNIQYSIPSNKLDHTGILLTPDGKFTHSKILPEIDSIFSYSIATTGACLLILKSDFDIVGGFDENYVNGCEDIDLCFKINDLGKEILVSTTSKILHYVSLSRNPISLQNEKNSQYLYFKWRKKIKLLLLKIWIDLLSNNILAYSKYLDGELIISSDFNIYLASLSISDYFLLREESRWLKLIKNSPTNSIWKSHLYSAGLISIPNFSGYFFSGDFEIYIDLLKSACNFFVCGRLLDDYNPTNLEFSIVINNYQKKTFRLKGTHVVNFGIVNPLLLSTQKNVLKFSAYFINDDGTHLKPATNVLFITHVVIDDHKFSSF